MRLILFGLQCQTIIHVQAPRSSAHYFHQHGGIAVGDVRVVVRDDGSQRLDLPTYYPDLPKAYHPTPQAKAIREDAIFVNIMRDGTVFFLYYGRATNVPVKALPEEIRQAVRSGSERKVYISADPHARYQGVEEVLKEIRSAGIEDVSFLALVRK